MPKNLITVALMIALQTFASEKPSLAPVKISKKDLKEDSALKDVAAKIQKAKLVTMSAKKTVYNAITEGEKTYTGEIAVAKGKMRLNFTEPEKTLVLINPKEIWVANYDLQDKEKAKQVIHIVSNKGKIPQLLLAVLGGNSLLNNFSIKKSSRREDHLTFDLAPKQKIEEVTKLQLVVDDKEKQIISIVYWDENDNKTSFDLSKIAFNEKIDSELFKFVPPKGVKVEEL